MQYSAEVENMCPVAKGAYHGPAPIPEEGKWVQAKEISDISGLTHGVGWPGCFPTCPLAAMRIACAWCNATTPRRRLMPSICRSARLRPRI